uniref:Uncharacterized protein n=1 Tax=Desertifilum tharense IPPAS B-1220 TaxID=1781255 RepID=A0ACD5GQT1_9CYAN
MCWVSYLNPTYATIFPLSRWENVALIPISLDPLADWRVKNRRVGLILGDLMLFKLLRNYTLVLTVAALASVTGEF